MKSIYDYTNYRDYLRDYYQEHRKGGLSYRSMARDMGFTSPNYLKLIIDGERHIGRGSIAQVCKGLELKKVESEYFSYLVFFAKAKNSVDKNYYYGQIARLRSGKMIATIDDAQFAYYDHWYNPVVRELVCGLDAEKIDYAELARRVSPAIHHKQAKQSVELLEKLGFIACDESGRYKHTSPLINSVNEVSSYAIKNYHKKMIELGSDSIDATPREKREISAVTMKVSEAGFAAIKERVQAFREEVLQMAQDDESVDRVMQLNMQFFPVSDEEEK